MTLAIWSKIQEQRDALLETEAVTAGERVRLPEVVQTHGTAERLHETLGLVRRPVSGLLAGLHAARDSRAPGRACPQLYHMCNVFRSTAANSWE